MAAAATKVGSTCELVENILIELDPKTLLFAQRVSQLWHNVIQGSHALQQALFFQPIQMTKEPLVVLPEDVLQASNGYVFKHQAVFNNPFAQPFLDLLSNPESKLTDTLFSEKWYRPKASWRRMLLTQPPIVTMLEIKPSGLGPKFNTGEQPLGILILKFLASIATGRLSNPCEVAYGHKLRELDSARQLKEVEAKINDPHRLDADWDQDSCRRFLQSRGIWQGW